MDWLIFCFIGAFALTCNHKCISRCTNELKPTECLSICECLQDGQNQSFIVEEAKLRFHTPYINKYYYEDISKATGCSLMCHDDCYGSELGFAIFRCIMRCNCIDLLIPSSYDDVEISEDRLQIEFNELKKIVENEIKEMEEAIKLEEEERRRAEEIARIEAEFRWAFIVNPIISAINGELGTVDKYAEEFKPKEPIFDLLVRLIIDKVNRETKGEDKYSHEPIKFGELTQTQLTYLLIDAINRETKKPDIYARETPAPLTDCGHLKNEKNPISQPEQSTKEIPRMTDYEKTPEVESDIIKNQIPVEIPDILETNNVNTSESATNTNKEKPSPFLPDESSVNPIKEIPASGPSNCLHRCLKLCKKEDIELNCLEDCLNSFCLEIPDSNFYSIYLIILGNGFSLMFVVYCIWKLVKTHKKTGHGFEDNGYMPKEYNNYT